MANTQIFVVSVLTNQGKTLLPNTARSCPLENSLSELFRSLIKDTKHGSNLLDYNTDDVTSIHARDHTKGELPIEMDPEMQVSSCKEFSCKYIQFRVSEKSQKPQSQTESNQQPSNPNAFSVMMAAQNTVQMPPKPSGDTSKMTGPQKLYSDIIDWAANFDQGWTIDILETGKTVLKKFSSALWYIDNCHSKIENNGCPVPKALRTFHGYSDYSKHHHPTPTITSQKLNEHCIELSKCLSYPSMNTRAHSILAGHLDSLLTCLTKYKDRLDKDNLRQQTIYKPEFKEAFELSMQPVIGLVNGRFGRMKFKEKPLTVYSGVPQQVIKASLEGLADTIGASTEKFNPTSTTKELRECRQLQDFIAMHCKSSHYSFQIMKCMGNNPCSYCADFPPRLDDSITETLTFLPCPVPDDDGQKFKDFDKIYGQEFDDSHRPSAQITTEFDLDSVELDKKNRELLKAGKARDAITCTECHKPRIIYSANRLTDEQDEFLRRLKEDESYVCGDSLPDCGMVTRSSLLCTSEVEVSYYSSSVRSFLPQCCFHCGTKEDLMESSDDYIAELAKQFSTVRPICVHCRAKGLDAKTWGRIYSKKNQENVNIISWK